MNAIPLIVIPDETEPGTAEIYVDGYIDGRPYRFLLDTGAARSSVLADAYTLPFPSAEQHASSGVFAASRDDLITVPEIVVGPIVGRDVPIGRVPADSPGKPTLIGMDLLKDYRCHFLFDENKLLVDQDSDPIPNPVPLFMDAKAHPYVDVQLGAVTGHAVWDTGASLTVVDLNFVQQYPQHFQADGTSIGYDATGTPQETPMFRMAAAAIGGRTFVPVRVAAVDLGPVNATIEAPMDLILGYNTLAQANWLFDFPRRTWTITKWLGEG